MRDLEERILSIEEILAPPQDQVIQSNVDVENLLSDIDNNSNSVDIDELL